MHLGLAVVQKVDKPSHWIILYAIYKAIIGLLDTVQMGPLERGLSGQLLFYPMFVNNCSQVDSSIIQHFNVQPG